RELCRTAALPGPQQAKAAESFHPCLNGGFSGQGSLLFTAARKAKKGFPLVDVKRIHRNARITHRILYNLAMEPGCEKYQQAYENSIHFGRLRA
ncbi:MAG: hypothetical protein ICV51_14875, partial [Flavisolibacter sp.]|nr:hypothetical protein [Flavisolibacter sp.]